ncbi:MAG: hypothetical protein J3R72DRAFT_426436 [Linnemannia gamsii]|nr:MAG: hypothetical protein J3R72DRAFT_426436 [Linnemannia gamsii]
MCHAICSYRRGQEIGFCQACRRLELMSEFCEPGSRGSDAPRMSCFGQVKVVHEVVRKDTFTGGLISELDLIVPGSNESWVRIIAPMLKYVSMIGRWVIEDPLVLEY